MRELYEGNAAEPLIDAELWAPLEEAIRTARRSIDITQLLFEPDFTPRARKLTDLLADAGARGARVRILVNENAAIPDSYDELRERFEGTAVEVRPLTMTPNVLHMKVFLVDEEDAFLVDSPFEQQYVDSSAHTRDAAYREDCKPLHAVSLRLRGACVARLGDLFESVWRSAGREPLQPLPERPRATRPHAGPHALRLAWSSPPGLIAEEPSEAIVEAYEEAIGRAKEYIYIENQYFTSPRIAAALRAALEREPGLEVILLLNVHMDLPGYDTWQARRLDELPRDHERVGVFALWAPARGRRVSLRQVYIHSKVCIVDDEWATVGSANLDSASLHPAEEFLVPFDQNVELNAILHEKDWATRLRRRLWSEHLADEGTWRAERPRLADWRRVADRNLAAYEAQEPAITGRVFPHESLAKEWRKPLWPRRKAA